MQGLTKRQQEIFEFIDSYIAKNKWSPSYREIQDHFDFSSLGTVYNHIKILKKKGLISPNTQQARSLTPQTKKNLCSLPLVGKLRAGYPIETFSKITMIPFPHQPTQTGYLLVIDGDSLLEESLQHNDLILVIPKTQYRNGDMVIATINNQNTIVKRAYSEKPFIRFISTTAYVHPIILREDHIQIQGVITTLLRSYSSSS